MPDGARTAHGRKFNLAGGDTDVAVAPEKIYEPALITRPRQHRLHWRRFARPNHFNRHYRPGGAPLIQSSGFPPNAELPEWTPPPKSITLALSPATGVLITRFFRKDTRRRRYFSIHEISIQTAKFVADRLHHSAAGYQVRMKILRPYLGEPEKKK